MSVWEGGEDGLSDLWESPHHKDSVYGDIETSDQQTLNLNTQSLPDVQSLPHSVVAHGWIPFMVVTAFSLVFSVLYVIWYRSDRPHHKAHGTSTIAVLGLFTTLVTTALVPVDVFLVSFMKNSDGTWKPWAEGEEVRESLKNSVLYAYYACYSLIFLFSFVIIPSNYFYHGLDMGLAEDDVEPSLSQKICHSFKYTLLSVFLFTILVISGIFLPFNGSPPSNSTEWQKIEWFFDELEANNGQDLLLFILNTVNIIGVSFLILYTGYGLSSLPCGLIRPTHGVRTRRTAVEIEIEDLERDIRAIEDRNNGGQVTGYEQTRLERLEQQVRLLRREHRDLDQRAKSLVSRCQLLMRPFQMVFGVIFSVFGFLLFLSLLLTNVDKALHSGGIYTGYSLVNSTLPNPADMLLVFTQQVFPLDYILYSLMVLFLLSCSISGITNIGIRCLCLLVYRVRAWRTPPRGMLLAVLLLMFIILAQNVIMISLVPDYTMFGNQHYIQELPDGNISVNRCSAKNMPTMKDACVPSRISVLLLSFHYKAWIFGAAYYWLTWVLLVSVLCGSLYSMLHMRTPTRPAADEAELLDSDDEETLQREDVPTNNPFD